jgi:hypothetical protein
MGGRRNSQSLWEESGLETLKDRVANEVAFRPKNHEPQKARTGFID